MLLQNENAPPLTRTQYVADILREKILKGQIAGGEALTQQKIAEEFNVSRIPVREALFLLQSEGLVEILPHKGASVVELSISKIKEIFELRKLLEVDLLRSAIPNFTDNDYQLGKAALMKFNEALNNEESIEHWSEYNQKFHDILYKPSRKNETRSLVNILNVRCARYIRMQLLYTKKIKTAQEEHLQLLELCNKRQIEAACELLHDHINKSCESMVEFLDNEK